MKLAENLRLVDHSHPSARLFSLERAYFRTTRGKIAYKANEKFLRLPYLF